MPHDPVLRRGAPMESRFWVKVDRDGPMPDFTDPLVRVTEADGNCWVWTASLKPGGIWKNYGTEDRPQS